MNLMVLNPNLVTVAIIDSYESLIWTDRYSKCGDFELCLPIHDSIPWYYKQDYMLVSDESDRAMIIETIETKSDAEGGNHLTVSGRSLESILDRRIIWGQLNMKDNLQNGIKTLIDSCFINPTDSKRKVDNFVFKESDDPIVTELNFEAQYNGDNLLEVIEGLCEDYKIGFKITISKDYNYVFELYAGVNRSYGQTKNTYVIFSPDFENMVNSSYITSSSNYKNIVLVAGEGEGTDRMTATVGSNEISGLDRREVFANASDISQGTDSAEYAVEDATEPQRGSNVLSEDKWGVINLQGGYFTDERWEKEFNFYKKQGYSDQEIYDLWDRSIYVTVGDREGGTTIIK